MSFTLRCGNLVKRLCAGPGRSSRLTLVCTEETASTRNSVLDTLAVYIPSPSSQDKVKYKWKQSELFIQSNFAAFQTMYIQEFPP